MDNEKQLHRRVQEGVLLVTVCCGDELSDKKKKQKKQLTFESRYFNSQSSAKLVTAGKRTFVTLVRLLINNNNKLK